MADSTKTSFDNMSDDDFDALTDMVLSDMQTEVPQSFFDAIGRCRCGRPKDEVHACV